MPSLIILIIECAQLTALMHGRYLSSVARKNAMIASPTYFNTYPPYADIVIDISCVNAWIIAASLSVGRSDDSLVEPTRSIWRITSMTFDLEYLARIS
jgi:hypothetical protein